MSKVVTPSVRGWSEMSEKYGNRGCLDLLAFADDRPDHCTRRSAPNPTPGCGRLLAIVELDHPLVPGFSQTS